MREVDGEMAFGKVGVARLAPIDARQSPSEGDGSPSKESGVQYVTSSPEITSELLEEVLIRRD